MKKLMILALLFLGCYYENELALVQVGSINNYEFENDLVVESESDIVAIMDSIDYTSDDEEYWQPPEETYNRIDEDGYMLGDCDDGSQMFLYLWKRLYKTECYMVLAEVLNSGKYHALNYADGNYYDAMNSWGDEDSPDLYRLTDLDMQNYRVMYIIPSGEAFWMAKYYHRAVGKYYYVR